MDPSSNQHQQLPWHITKSEIIVWWLPPNGISAFPTQRWSSVLPSAQRWSSVYPSVQRQVWVSSLHEVRDVLYDGPLSLGLLLGATKSHLPHWSGHGVHIGHLIASFFMMQLALMVAMVGPNTAAILKAPGALHEPFLVMGPSAGKQSLPWSQEAVSLTGWSPALFVGDGGSDLMICTFDSSGCCCWTILSPKLQLWGLHLGPRKVGGICLVATTGLEGCITSFHPGNQSGGCCFLVGSLVTFMMASWTGESVCIGWALTGVASFDWVIEGSSRRAMPLKMSLSEKEI